MNNNKDKSLLMWEGMSDIWGMVDNRIAINYMWQTMYAVMEQLENVYDSQSCLSIPSMPAELKICNVVLRPNNSNTPVFKCDGIIAKNYQSATVRNIPEIRKSINSDEAYRVGVDYTIKSGSKLSAIEITWLNDEAPPFGALAYFVPSIYIDNPYIDKHGAMLWDIGMNNSGMPVARQRDIYHALSMITTKRPRGSNVRNAINMIAGSPYSRYFGKISVGGDNSVTVNYAPELYVVKHEGVAYASETMTPSECHINGNVLTGDHVDKGDMVMIKTLDVRVIDIDHDNNVAHIDVSIPNGTYRMLIGGEGGIKTYSVVANAIQDVPKYISSMNAVSIHDVVVRSMYRDVDDNHYIGEYNIPDGDYDVSIYKPIDIDVTDCYAVNGEMAYSCMFDNIPPDTKHNVVSSGNYAIDKGINIVSSRLVGDQTDTPVGKYGLTVSDNDYVEPYTNVCSVANVYDWVGTGLLNAGSPGDISNYVYANYMQYDNAARYTMGAGAHGFKVGDTIIVDVLAPISCVVEDIDNGVVSVSVVQSVSSIYAGGSQSESIVYFSPHEEVSVEYNDGTKVIAIIAGGNYDPDKDGYNLLIDGVVDEHNVKYVIKKRTYAHIHVITEVMADGTIITDRTKVYGRYNESNCQIIVRKCLDETMRNNMYEISGVTPQSGSYKLTVNRNSGLTIANTSCLYAMVWSKDKPPFMAKIISSNNNEITVVVVGSSAAPALGDSLLVVGGLYDRSHYVVEHDNVGAGAIEMIGNLLSIVLPAGSTIEYKNKP